MESAYVLANRELEEIRQKNREKQSVRRAEVMLKAPELTEIEVELMRQGSRLLGCVLNKSEDFEQVKGKIQSLQKDINEIIAILVSICKKTNK